MASSFALRPVIPFMLLEMPEDTSQNLILPDSPKQEKEMADKHKLNDEKKLAKWNIQENLLTIVVLVFSFIYFLFQLYLWFTSPQN